MSIQQLFFSTGASSDKIVATGGTIYTSGNYKDHVFSSSGTFSISEINDVNASLQVLVVGGGGIGNSGTGAYFDYDGKDGGSGGNGALSRIYSGLAFGTYFNVANYSVTVGAQNTNDSQVANKTASPFICTSGQAAAQGGMNGAGAVYDSDSGLCTSSATAGSTSGAGYLYTGATSFYYGYGGGGGGGGGAQLCTSGAAGGASGFGEGAGGSGGNNLSPGNNGASASGYGSGGGGGGAGSDDNNGNIINGGTGGNGSSGVVVIRYLYK